mgnify:CR=1 FL=1
MTISPAWFFRAAVVYALIAMALGLHMGLSGDHSQLTAHAHINLVGWVSIFLYGTFLKLHPAGNGRLSALLWFTANAGVIVMAAGLLILYSGNVPLGDPLAGIGSIITILAMALFAVIVFRARD